eukprot:TRINITY_DN14850_c0_g2_i3.p1 TRINITY_DN14850_c0_g2~~TRINITY_DN14850_c0_g2_i3.p1  ORF type:complete len:451 (+),score=89.96 TRINITY_DN14850_c0_g2_i3:55-1353(+)
MACDAAEAWPAEPPGWLANIERAKKLERTDITTLDWQKFGFGTARAEDFAALAAAPDRPPGAVARLSCRELTRESFWERFERTGTPCVISDIPDVEGWPLWRSNRWADLPRRFPKCSFKVGKADDGSAVRIRAEDFAQYMAEQQDDSPLYLFDNKFGGNREGVQDQLLREYKVPSYFPDDYMALAGEDDRPPYRWMAVGPRRSGTVMHQDPLCTSAWNTLLSGRKRWVLLHPDTPRKVAKAKTVMRPGDDDEAVNVFIDLLPRMHDAGVETIEFVQYPGETVFLPGNWWHCVVNLDDAVAVTQNYCGRLNFDCVWRSARVERPCWSAKWLRAMAAKLPEVAERARALNSADGFDMAALLRKNQERRERRRQRRAQRELRKARRKAGAAFDEAAWWVERKKQRAEASSGSSSSTVSTSSESDSTTSTTSSSGA